MIRKVFILIVLVLGFINAAASITFNGNERARYNFNLQWLLHIGDNTGGKAFSDPSLSDKPWNNVDLPRTFNEDEA